MNEDYTEDQQMDRREEYETAMEALRKARALGLGESECMALAYCAGIATDFYKELRK